MSLLVLNSGSSSLKYHLFDGVPLSGVIDTRDSAGAVRELMERLPHGVELVGHRVVNGYHLFGDAVVLDDSHMTQLRDFARSSGITTHYELDNIAVARQALPRATHVAVFDSAFHRTLPREAFLYALPWDQYEAHGIRRWGFHGLSHESVSEAFAPRRVVSCHLGNGASICAIRDGMSVDTSMGFTTLEGLAMGSRAGDVDAGVVFDLLIRQGLAPTVVAEMLTKRSGLLGLSGVSADFREVARAAAEGHERARIAIAVYCYRVRKYIGAYAAALGGIDVLVFTGGIGEHSADVRRGATAELGFLGITVGAARNAAAEGRCRISPDGAKVEVWVAPASEERIIARETRRAARETPGTS